MKGPEKNYVLGAGKIRIALEDEAGNLTGERYIGNTPGFTVAVETEGVELYDSDGPTAEKVEDVVTQVSRSGTVTVNDIAMENLALFVMGDIETVAQTDTPVTGYELLGVVPGLYYPLGIGPENPTGVRGVTAVSVSYKGGAEIPAEAGGVTNWELDAATGSLHIPDGSSIPADSDLVVSYTPDANTRERIATSNLGTRFGSLRFIADNTRGKNRSLYAPRVKLAPSGDAAWKSRDTWMELQFSLEFLRRGDLAALYIDGVPVAVGGST